MPRIGHFFSTVRQRFGRTGVAIIAVIALAFALGLWRLACVVTYKLHYERLVKQTIELHELEGNTGP